MALSWVSDWSWGLLLLVLTVVAHVTAIVWTAKVLTKYRGSAADRMLRFVVFVAVVALASAVYLGLEAAAWAGLYLWLGALPDRHDAMLYSLGSITSYGHAPILLGDRWRLRGAIEAVNGPILFGQSSVTAVNERPGSQASCRRASSNTLGRFERLPIPSQMAVS